MSHIYLLISDVRNSKYTEQLVVLQNLFELKLLEFRNPRLHALKKNEISRHAPVECSQVVMLLHPT